MILAPLSQASHTDSVKIDWSGSFQTEEARYENLKSLGIQEPTSVDSYTLRQEANHDILKIYFKKQKGEFFAKSVKFKYPRQRKTMLVDSGTHEYKDVTEINANLKYVVDELDNLTQGVHVQADRTSSRRSCATCATWKKWCRTRSAKSSGIWKSSKPV